jgi:predicted GNAT superfamily acetyltransferase
MRDGLNNGLPSDRFQVDWWLNTKRVERRLSLRPRPVLDLEHYLIAGTTMIEALKEREDTPHLSDSTFSLTGALLLFEIPSNFPALKAIDLTLARDWRFYSRNFFEDAFASGYLVTDFVHDKGRSYYVLTHSNSTLQDDQ